MYAAKLGVILLTGGMLMSVPALALEGSGKDLPAIQVDNGKSVKKKSRLKYRNGPTCMCEHALTEDEIRHAHEQRRKQQAVR